MKEYNPHKQGKVDPEWVTLQFDLVLHETEKAILVVFGEQQEWFPKSQCDIIDETYSHIQVSKWLMEKKSLEQYLID